MKRECPECEAPEEKIGDEDCVACAATGECQSCPEEENEECPECDGSECCDECNGNGYNEGFYECLSCGFVGEDVDFEKDES